MQNRLSREEMNMEMAHTVAKRGTCTRLQVGAILTYSDRVISTGYNGVVMGESHCNHTQDESKCLDAVHAEANAIVFAARNGVRTLGSTLYVTHSPCLECAKLIVNSGIMNVFYDHEYRLKDGLELLVASGVMIKRLGNKV